MGVNVPPHKGILLRLYDASNYDYSLRTRYGGKLNNKANKKKSKEMEGGWIPHGTATFQQRGESAFIRKEESRQKQLEYIQMPASLLCCVQMNVWFFFFVNSTEMGDQQRRTST